MKATDHDLREALGLEPPRREAERAECPTAEALVLHAERAAAGAAVVERPDAVLEHVAGCGPCAEEYRLALALEPWAHGAAAALGRAAPRRRPWTVPALAASLLVAAGVAGWNLQLRRQLALQDAELVASRRSADAPAHAAVNVPIVSLDAGAARGPEGGEAVLQAPADATWVTFVLAVSGDPPSGAHALEMRDADGRVIWRGDGLRVNRFGTFTVAVPSALLPPGRYTLVLSRRGATGALETYRLVVLPPA